MVRKRKKKLPQDPEEKLKKQDQMNKANAAVLIRHSFESVVSSGVALSLIEILETVKHWPSIINGNDPSAFVPQFNATKVSAEEITEHSDIITRVSFSYSDKRYDFVSRIDDVSSSEQTHGNIVLHENGEWVINMDIVKKQGQDNFNFRDLKAFRQGPWMEEILSIAFEIESHEI